MSNDLVYFNNQLYHYLKKKSTFPNFPFQDDTFPPNFTSLSPTGMITNLSDIVWKRPNEICDKPCMFIDGCSTRDVCQGQLGNCWFVSSMAVLALHPKILEKVIPSIPDQEDQFTNSNKYAGIFRFQFWRYGEWVEVVIDDFLPTRAGKLIFSHSKENHEFWSALLEKAYAKVCGSYECMIGGQEEESLVDFSGGIPEQIFELKKYATSSADMESIFKLMELDYKSGSMICSSIASRTGEMEERLSNGLVTTHSYSVTKVARIHVEIVLDNVDHKDVGLMMVRIRNPWGQKEWTGAFSDESVEWQKITSEEKLKIAFKIENDGEFWMLIKDFLLNFNQLTIVRLIKTGMLQFNSNWYGAIQRGYWTDACFDRDSAIRGDDGGEQLRIDITKPGGDIILIHLLQKCNRMMDTYLALLVIKVEQNRQTAMHSIKWGQVALEYRLGGSRAICLRYRLPWGTYIIKPYPTQNLKENKPLYYILRCFTTQNNHGFQLLSEPSYAGQCCSSSKSKIISRLRLVQGNFTKSATNVNASKMYCEIKCENQTFRTNLSTSSKVLLCEDSFLLYRCNPGLPVLVSIIESSRLINSTLGCVIYQFNEANLNTADVVSCTDQVLAPDLKAPSKIIASLQTQWFHTDNSERL